MKQKQSRLLQLVINGLLFAIVAGLIGALSVRYKVQLDWTAGHRNTLTEPSRKLLKLLPDPITFTVFDYAASENRPAIAHDIGRYKQFKPNITIDYVDPSRDPVKVKQFAIDEAGEVVVEYQGRRETLHGLSEPEITSALQRLSENADHYVMFLQGDGERAIEGKGSQEDYDSFVQALRSKGLKVEPLNLVKTPQVPANASALVIATPTQKLLDGEVKLIVDYVNKGGNLLWLTDPDEPTGLDDLAKTLGVTWLPGYAVMPDYQLTGAPDPRIFLATEYPPGPITSDLGLITMFPLVRAMQLPTAGEWHAEPFLQTGASAWLDTSVSLDAPAQPVTLEKKPGDVGGPLTIGAILTRDLKPDPGTAAPAKPADAPKSQRVVLVGDSDFLSNQVLDNVGNKQLGLNIIQWLASRDGQLNIDVPKAPDTSLYLPGWAMILISIGFTLLLPLLLVGYGATRWLSRRRQ
jgi:ABC-type uncharacterized transport system involved in gliding motility auxiliary subunit